MVVKTVTSIHPGEKLVTLKAVNLTLDMEMSPFSFGIIIIIIIMTGRNVVFFGTSVFT